MDIHFDITFPLRILRSYALMEKSLTSEVYVLWEVISHKETKNLSITDKGRSMQYDPNRFLFMVCEYIPQTKN